MSVQTPIFVLSSGRTGSTLLARMIDRHPDLLCVSDLFEPVGSVPYFDRNQVLDGPAFFGILSRPSFPQRTRYWRLQANAELLFLHDDDEMVSLLLSYTLPFLTKGQPMALFEEIRVACSTRGLETMPSHLIWLFDWLRDRFGSKVWIERTGGSLPHTDQIVARWPEAKIVHNYRDPRETAISMLTGSFFRLYLELSRDPDLAEWDSEFMPPVEDMGAMLNGWMVDAVPVLDKVPDGQKINLAYEDLLGSPEDTLLRFACFVLDRSEPTAADRVWAAEQASTIRPPSLKFPRLSPDDQARLEAAVAPAVRLLGYG